MSTYNISYLSEVQYTTTVASILKSNSNILTFWKFEDVRSEDLTEESNILLNASPLREHVNLNYKFSAYSYIANKKW